MDHREALAREPKPDLSIAGSPRPDPDAAALAPTVPTFAATQLDRAAAPRAASVILLVLSTLLYLWNLGSYPIYTKGEPREAVTIYDMVHGGGVILPMRAGVEIPSKPLLMHWCAALISLAAGTVNEWTIRLPTALFAIAGLLVCYGYVRKLYDDRIALIAALIMGTTFQYLQAASGARVDMTLTFFLEVAFFEFILIAEDLTRRRMLLYVAISLAVLAKGPIGLLLPALVGAMWIVVMRRWDLLRKLHLVRGALVVLVLGGSWYALAIWLGGKAFVDKQLIAENLNRFLGGAGFHEGHAHWFMYVELSLLAGFMPWTIIVPIAGVVAQRRPLAMTPRLTYLMLWFATVLVFFNLAHSKRGVYLLALYPALATIMAVYFCEVIADPAPFKGALHAISAVTEAALVALGVSALVAVGTLVAAPSAMREVLKLFDVRVPEFVANLTNLTFRHWILAASAPLICEVLGLHLARRPASFPRVIGVIVAAMACATLAANVIVVPAIANTLSVERFARETVAAVGSDRLGYLGELDYDFAFYSGRTFPIVSLNDSDLPDYLVAFNSTFASLPISRRAKLWVVMSSGPTELDGSDKLVLLRTGGPPRPPPGGSIEAGARILSRGAPQG